MKLEVHSPGQIFSVATVNTTYFSTLVSAYFYEI